MAEPVEEYVFTDHGRERFLKRFACAPNKRTKVLRKAWSSKNRSHLINWKDYKNGEWNKMRAGTSVCSDS